MLGCSGNDGLPLTPTTASDQSSQGTDSSNSSKRELGWLSLYGLLLFVYLLPASLSPLDTLPSLTESDASQALWALENYEISGSTFIDKAFPPRGVDYGYIHWMAVPLLLGQLSTGALGTIGAYNFLLFLGLSGSCYGANLLARSQGLSWSGAWVTGLGYGLCPMLAGQIMAGHLFYVFGAAFVPFYLLALVHFVRTPKKWVGGAWVVVLWLLMMRSCIYYCLFLIPLSFLVVISEGLKQTRRPIRQAFLLLVVGIVGSLLGLSQSQANSDTALLMPRANVEMFGSDLLAMITPSPYHPLWGDLFQKPGDAVGFCGFTLLVLSALSLRKNPSLAALAMALVAWLTALGPVLYLGGQRLGEAPWSGLFSLPGFEGIQVYARAMLVFQLLIALGAGRVIKTNRSAGLVTVLLLFEFWMAPIGVQRGSEAEIFRQLSNEPEGTVLSIPYQAENTQALYHQTLHQKRILRPPVLRPSTELVAFYAQFPWLEHFSQPRGFESLSQVETKPFTLLTGLRYFSLDKSRLEAFELEPWTGWIKENFRVSKRWENESFLILAVQPNLPPGEGLNDSLEIDFSRPGQGYCSWGLAPRSSDEESPGRLAQDQRIDLWLPISRLSDRRLELSGLDSESSAAQVLWNDNFLGLIRWSSRHQVSQFEIPSATSTVGANKLSIILHARKDDDYRSFGLSKLRLQER